MSLVKFGGGIVQMSGSIAGNTFARNRYGNYVRSRTKPVNPQTTRQSFIRAGLAFLTSRWGTDLTANQRTAWNLYASSVAMKNRLGEVIYMTGFNHYIRSNMIRKQIALAIIDDGPTTFEIPAADPTFAITASEATQDISTSYDDGMDWASVTGAYMIVYGGQPQNAQRNFFAGPWKVFGVIAGVDAAPPEGPNITASPFALTEGQRLWCYARILKLDGRLSEKFRADTFCTA